MNSGSFSVSLSVKDIARSKDFYEKLGFEPIGGDQQQNWLILKNSDHIIGLFQGMVEQNILTFNPGCLTRYSVSVELWWPGQPLPALEH